MESKEEQGSGGARARYVWDREKLAWVEAEQAPAQGQVESEAVGPEVRTEGGGEATVAAPEQVEAVLVEEELEIRGPWIRLAGTIVDFILLYIVSYVLTLIIPSPWVPLGLGFVYFVGLWSWRGQTLGKMLIKARVVRSDGRRIGILNAFVRYIFYLVPIFGPLLILASFIGWVSSNYALVTILACAVGFAVVGLTRRRRGLHDLVAGTCVVNTSPSMPVEVRSAPSAEEVLRKPDASDNA